jgi:hypothetical protein
LCLASPYHHRATSAHQSQREHLLYYLQVYWQRKAALENFLSPHFRLVVSELHHHLCLTSRVGPSLSFRGIESSFSSRRITLLLSFRRIALTLFLSPPPSRATIIVISFQIAPPPLFLPLYQKTPSPPLVPRLIPSRSASHPPPPESRRDLLSHITNCAATVSSQQAASSFASQLAKSYHNFSFVFSSRALTFSPFHCTKSRRHFRLVHQKPVLQLSSHPSSRATTSVSQHRAALPIVASSSQIARHFLGLRCQHFRRAPSYGNQRRLFHGEFFISVCRVTKVWTVGTSNVSGANVASFCRRHSRNNGKRVIQDVCTFVRLTSTASASTKMLI